MRVVLLHNELPPDASLAERDLLVQMEAVSAAMASLGHETVRVPCTLNLQRAADELAAARPDAVFNLVESFGGSDWLVFAVAGFLDTLRLPYTGSLTNAVYLSADKLLGKQRLAAAGLPTPAWRTPRGPGCDAAQGAVAGRRWIAKSVTQHASFGLDDDPLVADGPPDTLAAVLRGRSVRYGGDWFLEEYIEGREFNLAMLASPAGSRTLPPAEIRFPDFPPGKPRIVGYRAKWEEDTFEYQHTVRAFDFAPADRPLLDRLAELSEACWDLFNLGGYARVDFRVDVNGRPWILEINTNPCLSPDAGLAAAFRQAGISYEQAIARILDDALARRPA